MDASFDAARAFGGIDRLFGAGTHRRLAAAHVVVVGVGGVGSWAVEALARCGVGQLTLIDADHLAESNLNRQLPALCSTLGQAKVQALRTRIADIFPSALVHAVDEFLTPENLHTLLPASVDCVVDAMDAPKVKAALAHHCQRVLQRPLVMCGAAGGKTDPTRLAVCDLRDCTHDPLLASVRTQLRRRYAYPSKERMHVLCVSSDEPRIGAVRCASTGAPLACAGYGSLVTVTATMGMIAAHAALRTILSARSEK